MEERDLALEQQQQQYKALADILAERDQQIQALSSGREQASVLRQQVELERATAQQLQVELDTVKPELNARRNRQAEMEAELVRQRELRSAAEAESRVSKKEGKNKK